MRIKYLESSDPGMDWMRLYYSRNPQLNRAKALASLQTAERTLTDFPRSGHKFQDLESVLEYPIQGTNFSFLYTVARATIWVIDVRDQRGHRSAEALRMYDRELRKKYGI